MTQYAERTVGALVTERPSRSRIFEAHGIDYCCGGKRTLAAACEKKKVPLETVVDQLARADAAAPPREEDYASWPFTRLIAHIVETHHAWLRRELPRLHAMAERVAKVHGEKDPRLEDLARTFYTMEAELTSHMGKEEMVLFPMVEKLEAGALPVEQAAFLRDPIACMESEHDAAGEALARMRALTGDFTPPAEACNTWRALLDGLSELEADLHQHIHKENNILFPAVLEQAEIVAGQATA